MFQGLPRSYPTHIIWFSFCVSQASVISLNRTLLPFAAAMQSISRRPTSYAVDAARAANAQGQSTALAAGPANHEGCSATIPDPTQVEGSSTVQVQTALPTTAPTTLPTVLPRHIQVTREIPVGCHAAPVRSDAEMRLVIKLYFEHRRPNGSIMWDVVLHDFNLQASLGSPSGGVGGPDLSLRLKLKKHLQAYMNALARQWNAHYAYLVTLNNLNILAQAPTGLNRTEPTTAGGGGGGGCTC